MLGVSPHSMGSIVIDHYTGSSLFTRVSMNPNAREFAFCGKTQRRMLRLTASVRLDKRFRPAVKVCPNPPDSTAFDEIIEGCGKKHGAAIGSDLILQPS
jgi:hypothetical protein